MTTQVSHTPGPWFTDEDLIASESLWIYAHKHLVPICQIAQSGYEPTADGGCLVTTDGDIANARLIVAAPDLLSICKQIQKRFAGEGTYDSDLDAVIAKAEGGR